MKKMPNLRALIGTQIMKDIGIVYHINVLTQVRTLVIKPEGTWHMVHRFRDTCVEFFCENS